MTTPGPDLPSRVLAAAVRVLPTERHDWGRAMHAELVVVGPRRDRWAFAWGCVRVTAAQHRPLRAGLHLGAVLATLATVFAWAATVDYPPLFWGLNVVVSVLAAVCWQARRAAMLGPVGDGPTAWLLRVGGYLIAGAIAAIAVAHTHPATASAAEDGIGVLVVAVVGASYLLGVATVCARRSAATLRVPATAVGCGLAGAAVWLATTVLAPPIPPSTGWAITLSGFAAVAGVAANSGRYYTPRRGLLVALLAAATTMVLIFVAVDLLAAYGPDSLIPNITPRALPAARVSESRIEIVDPYVLILAVSALFATTLSVASVVTRQLAAGSSDRATLATATA